MPDDPSITRNSQPKPIPRGSPFLTPDKALPGGECTHDEENAEPPVTRNQMMHLHQYACRQGQNSAVLRHELGQLRDHEGDENRDESRAGKGKECRINQRLLHAITQAFRLHQVFH